MYSVSLPPHNNSMLYCGFQQWGSDKTWALMRAPPPTQEHPIPAQTLQHSPDSPLPQAAGLVMAGLRWAEAELQTALPKPQGSGLFHSCAASQTLNHFPHHYRKTFVFPHPHPPPLKTVAGFNHLNERIFASGEVSTVMSPIKNTPTHPHTFTVRPMIYIPPLDLPKYSHAKDIEREEAQAHRHIHSHWHWVPLVDGD